MKSKIITKQGTGKEIEIPKLFSQKIREDIVQKYYETVKSSQPYSPSPEAGKQFSALGKVRHARHKWKGHYGRGISRVPRKIFWRRGTQFYWEAAGVSGTVGGRRAHPPKIVKFQQKKKINKKEILVAIKSALSSTISKEHVLKRYSSLQEISLPILISSESLKLNTKQFSELLKKILKKDYQKFTKKKIKRQGKAKLRRGRNKTKKGLLIIIGNNEQFLRKSFDIKKVSELSIEDIYPLGRLTIYTESALSDLDKLLPQNKEDKKRKTKSKEKEK